MPAASAPARSSTATGETMTKYSTRRRLGANTAAAVDPIEAFLWVPVRAAGRSIAKPMHAYHVSRRRRRSSASGEF